MIKDIFETIELLEENKFYRLADRVQNSLLKLAAFPYNLSAPDELPMTSRYVDWDRIKEDLGEEDNIQLKKLKIRIPDYKRLNIDKDDTGGIENRLNGEDSIPGPAIAIPESQGRYPSVNGNLDDFTWEASHESNNGPDYWKNLVPRR